MRSSVFWIMVTSNLKIYFQDKIVLPYIYGLLFALSIVLINPWGGDRAEIWTEPKLFIIQAIVLLNLLVLLRQVKTSSLVVPVAWKIASCLWILFLCTGVISTFLSPSWLRSFWGQPFVGDGLFYWCFVAACVVSNALVLNLKPELARHQLYGLLAGGVILAFSVFIQVYDWRIDFTANSGQISESHLTMLKSSIWKPQMPIGFYTNRGEAALPLAVAGVLAILGLLWGWLSTSVGGIIYVLVCTALFYTKCRGALLGLLVATSYLLVRFRSNKRVKIIAYGLGLLIVSFILFKISAMVLTPEFTTSAPPHNFKLNLGSLDSSRGRLKHWKLALQGIVERPWFGWGFDGFGLAFPYIADWTGQHRDYLFDKVDVSEIFSVQNFIFTYLGTDNKVHVGLIMAAKVHNFVLDTVISVGIIGFISYISIFIFFIWCAFNSAFLGIEATAIAYLVYTMTWYESGQFSHLGWWGLSVGLGCTKLFQNKK